MIVFLTKDLFFIPVLQSAAARHGAEVCALLNLDSPKAASIDAAQVTACVIDLSGTETSTIEDVVQRLRSTYPSATIAAFGPHVQEARLEAAQAAGCEQVLTRGQLNKQIDALMAGWADV